MADALSALDILASSSVPPLDTAAVVVLHGDEPFLVREMLALLRDALCPDEGDRSWAWREFAGEDDQLDPRDVFDEAATMPMFATATRAAVVRSADPFVTATRERLEALASGPRGSRGIVILEVKTFTATTRLAKAVAKDGLVIETSIPKGANLAAWVRKWAPARHGIQLAVPTAQRLLERLGGDIGQIDQALARLAAATPPADRTQPLGPEAVEDFVGSPQERTAWEMIDAATTGDAAAAIKQLAELLATGENPIGIAAQIAAVLRRLSTAARLLALPVGHGRPPGVEQALREAGVAAWPKAMNQAKAGLMQLGPRRARQLPIWLFDLDLALKGDASRGLRARLALERLFCKMGRTTELGARPTPRTASGARQ
ncbi:MAG: DNA polymerase III subunit delta [Pirellulales bacterium]